MHLDQPTPFAKKGEERWKRKSEESEDRLKDSSGPTHIETVARNYWQTAQIKSKSEGRSRGKNSPSLRWKNTRRKPLDSGDPLSSVDRRRSYEGRAKSARCSSARKIVVGKEARKQGSINEGSKVDKGQI